MCGQKAKTNGKANIHVYVFSEPVLERFKQTLLRFCNHMTTNHTTKLSVISDV